MGRGYCCLDEVAKLSEAIKLLIILLGVKMQHRDRGCCTCMVVYVAIV